MQTPQTPNFVRSDVSDPYKHPHLGELCAQTPTNTHFLRLIEKIHREQTSKNDLPQHKHPESVLYSTQTHQLTFTNTHRTP